MKLKHLILTAALAGGLAASPAPARDRLEVKVISSPRADLVSGGDALVEVRGAGGDLSWTLNGKLVAPPQPDAARGSLVGLVAGLQPGKNLLLVRSGKASGRLAIVNHYSYGTILAGPHIWPNQCNTEMAGLGPATDRMCNAPTKVERYYRT
jgi:hypothetical protein